MLTIVNIEKLYKRDVGEWRIGRVETLDSSYLIKLYKHNRRETKQVNIERKAIGMGEAPLYELWFWSDDLLPIPIRTLLSKRDLESGSVYVIELIKDMLKC
jgi:hypothetical protein